MYPYDDDYFDELDYMFRQRPPFGPPGGGGFFPPGGPGGPGGPPGGQPSGAPSCPPPAFTPSQSLGQVAPLAIDPGAISGYRFRFVYIWLDNGSSFWAFLTFVGRRSIAGFRWQRGRWVYFGIDTRRISSFYCY